MTLPIIGVTSSQTAAEANRPPVQGVKRTYLDAISASGGIPIILSPTVNNETLERILSLVSGIVLPGGGDIQSSIYGEPPHETNYGTDEERDLFEVKMAQLCYERDKPLLGICRGMQVMNVALGGTLIQDIPSCIPHAPPHRDTEHSIIIHRDSLLSKLINTNSCIVNSYHHQALGSIASGLSVTAEADEGVIEAVEAGDRRFYIGVQWHPEVLVSAVESASAIIFRSSISTCR